MYKKHTQDKIKMAQKKQMDAELRQASAHSYRRGSTSAHRALNYDSGDNSNFVSKLNDVRSMSSNMTLNSGNEWVRRLSSKSPPKYRLSTLMQSDKYQ